MTQVVAGGLVLELPDRWQVVEQEPDESGLAPFVAVPAPWPEDYGFRPSLNVVTAPLEPPGASVDALGTLAVAAALQVQDAHVVGYDVWPMGDPAHESPDDGRRVLFGYRLGDTGVVETQWLFVRDGRAITVTLSCDTARYARVLADLDGTIGSMRFAEVAA